VPLHRVIAMLSRPRQPNPALILFSLASFPATRLPRDAATAAARAAIKHRSLGNMQVASTHEAV
jgi:hypothetical protein